MMKSQVITKCVVTQMFIIFIYLSLHKRHLHCLTRRCCLGYHTAESLALLRSFIIRYFPSLCFMQISTTQRRIPYALFIYCVICVANSFRLLLFTKYHVFGRDSDISTRHKPRIRIIKFLRFQASMALSSQI